METQKKRKNVYDIVTARIIEQLEKGIIPWCKNINALPKNLITLKPYRGVNVLLLTAMDFKQPYFLSTNQLKELGGTLKENEKPTPVVYWKKFGENDRSVLRYFNVYNVAQCEGIHADRFHTVAETKDKIELCKEIVLNMPNKPDIIQNSELSFYSAKSDYVAMQPEHFFRNADEYYSMLFQHLLQSTGCDKRLNRREFYDYFNSTSTDEFHIEKLIVQIGTFIIKAHCGISGSDADKSTHSVLAYLEKLRVDSKLIVYACFRAQQAVDYILNTRQDIVAKEDTL